MSLNVDGMLHVSDVTHVEAMCAAEADNFN